MQILHFFAGGNTAQGFCSCFEDILPAAQRKRMYFIKGGPGVGKSTLMKRVGAAAEEKGLKVEYFHCSSDPDSLDGVSVPEQGIGLMDGTAPHVYDPAVPGARDTLLSLGDFLDEEALRPHAGEIAEIQRDISARFARCYRYLAAAREVLCAAPPPVENAARARQLADGWAHSLPLRGGNGSVRRLFASAFTPKGLVTVSELSGMDRCVTVECPFGAYASELMSGISRMAAARGLDVIELLDPLCPDRIAHVMIPAHGVAFCTARQGEERKGEYVEASALFTGLSGNDAQQRFDVNAYELLCQRATEQIAAAKALHDQLEAFYVKNMDFKGWQTVVDRVTDFGI